MPARVGCEVIDRCAECGHLSNECDAVMNTLVAEALSARREHAELKEAWTVVVEELGLTSEFASDADHGKICDALRELNALALETLSAREDALRHEGRADYFASLLTRLLATRQGRTVGYEPPEVQELWRKVEKAIEGKEGAK